MQESLKFGSVLIQLWVSMSREVTKPEDQQASNKGGSTERSHRERHEGPSAADMAVVRGVIEPDEKEEQEA